MNLRKSDEGVTFLGLSINHTSKNIKTLYRNNEFRISGATLDEEFELPDGSYSVSDIQGYFQCIIKKHETLEDNPPVQIYVNKIQNRVTFKIKSGSYLELLTPETMKLLASTEEKIIKDKNGENLLQLKITELVLVHFNIVNNQYEHDSRVLSTFVPSKPFDQLLIISPTNHVYTNTFYSEFSSIKVRFTDQSSMPLEIDRINLTLVINLGPRNTYIYVFQASFAFCNF